MIRILKIKRQEDRQGQPYWQSFEVTPPARATIAWALADINKRIPLLDAKQTEAKPVGWDCGCMQQACGACAMVIGGTPSLACACFFDDYPPNREIAIQPLTKFPVIQDLSVDKTLLEENLLSARAWLEGDAKKEKRTPEMLQQLSKCIMCGCCYEACPNCLPGSDFVGPAALHTACRAMKQDTDAANAALIRKTIRRHGTSICSKSLACENVCPAEIGIAKTLIRI